MANRPAFAKRCRGQVGRRNPKLQNPNPNRAKPKISKNAVTLSFVFGFGHFDFAWDLEIGIWNFWLTTSLGRNEECCLCNSDSLG